MAALSKIAFCARQGTIWAVKMFTVRGQLNLALQAFIAGWRGDQNYLGSAFL